MLLGSHRRARDESKLTLAWDAASARRRGSEAVLGRQRERLTDLVRFARTHSPYYRRLYHGLPDRITDPTLLPVSSKTELMPNFDDWVTDAAATLQRAQDFAADPAQIGKPFCDAYTLVTTSGTTGHRGIFLIDQRTKAVTSALSARMISSWLSPSDPVRIARRGGRIAMINATGGHYASATGAAALQTSTLGRSMVASLSVHTPTPDLVAELNAIQPAVLVSYASTGAMLAEQQRAGRLRIDPSLVVLAAEGLSDHAYRQIATSFGATVGHSYAASECSFLSYSCSQDWLHVNSDWAILEPVDDHFRPVPAGTRSHTVLLTNLANRIQPILRYDLGDSVLVRPDPCPCGNRLPALRVQGRVADQLTLTTADHEVVIGSLTVGSLLDRIPGIEQAQIVQTGATDLRIRTRVARGADPESVWLNIHDALGDLLARHGLGQVTVTRGAEPPEQTSGGKFRTVLPTAEA